MSSDCPSIVSGPYLAYLEPQEKIWKGEAGKMFDIADIHHRGRTDALQPFQQVCGFKAGMSSFPGTIFRFPLRTIQSEISRNTYTLQQLQRLFGALRKEAKVLLLFLRSVHNIEVHEVSDSGSKLSFRISIEEESLISHQRSQFMKQLTDLYASQSSGIILTEQQLSEFHVKVMDGYQTQQEVSHWLVLTQVGSDDQEVLGLAAALQTLPWVGVAMELLPLQCGKPLTVGRGRIFCFLPMPIEASSPFPVHVNGTLGLNDDRRTLKWSGPDRQNDPTAQWNEVVISKLLPQCYVELLMSAQKHLQPSEFYLMWPEVSNVKDTPWECLLQPFFQSLFCNKVVLTEQSQAFHVDSKWIHPCSGVFIPQGQSLPSAVHNALSSTNVQLVIIPPIVWRALEYNRVPISEVDPRFTRNCLRKNRQSYLSIDRMDRLEILRYCLSDNDYNDLFGLCLLPLADKISWADFKKLSFVYLCTMQCPAYLLPNQEHIIVEVLEDEELQSDLMTVASMGTTQLRELTAKDVAQLLPQSFPKEWQGQQIISVPHFQFPMDWFEKFWKWVYDKALGPFIGQPLIPLCPADSPPASFQVARLNEKGSILYIPEYVTSPQYLLGALDKLQVLYSKQSVFPYLVHMELKNYLTTFNSDGILDAVSKLSLNIQLVIFSKEEADSMKSFLVSPLPVLNACRQQVLQNLKLFTTLENSSSKLCSVSECTSASAFKAAIMIPVDFILQTEYLPSTALIFSAEHHQALLLGLLQSKGLVFTPTNANFLLQYIFPLIPDKLSRNALNSIMEDVLDQLPLIKREGELSQIGMALKSLQFIEDKRGHYHSPSELYDPSIEQLQQLFNGTPVFPNLESPFIEERYMLHLRGFGLRQSVQPQDIIDIIISIALSCAVFPQQVDATKLSRAKAALKYIAGCTSQQLQSEVTIPGYQEASTFQSALQHLAINLSWLPVCSFLPQAYPQGLAWKGSLCNSHFVCLDNSTLVLSTQNASSLPLIIGSQVYMVYTQLSKQTAEVFSLTESTEIMHVITHFKQVISIAKQVPAKEMETFIHSMYNYLNVARQSGSQSQLQTLRSIPRWIWLRKQHRFISPNLVAAEENETFTHKLEPYIFLLPDELFKYTELFVHFNMPWHVSDSQIVSVLKMIHSVDQSMLEPKLSWGIVLSILNWLTGYGEKEVSLPGGCTLYVPIESNLATPVLKKANDVVYTDNDFLKNYLSSVQTEESFTCVHERIYPKLAYCLGLSSLSDYLDITEDTFQDAGQHEPLIVRLKNILRDYKDGLTIIKELIQNADYAEATEVNICYDTRTVLVDSNTLLFPGMVSAHGPALVVHNNAVFSKDDIENITKLAGATKEDKPLKIGKFGIGFCSVYHITDVPSFVSQDTLCIFDPTLSCLRKEIKDPVHPGKRVKFTAKLLSVSNQLVPYNGLFGFKQGNAYEGTLFRFPFRIHPSELSNIMYSESMVNDMQSEIFQNASKLLIFLQNVKKITFSRIKQGDRSPTTLLEVVKTSKSVSQAITHTIISKCSSESTPKEHWLVATETHRVRLKSATASVACQLTVSELFPTLKQPKPVQGEAFCFLPLAVKTGLPVHVSANFAVKNNRRGIWTSDGESRSNFEVEWNEEHMQKVIPLAYYQLLLALKDLDAQEKLVNYDFCSLWPLKTHEPWSMLLHTVYSYLQSSELFYSSAVNKWQAVNESIFLARDILTMSLPNVKIPQSVLDVVKYLQLPVVHLAEEYRLNLNLTSSIITEEMFVSLFFEKIDALYCDRFVLARNDVLCIIFEVYAMELDANTPRYKYLDMYLRRNPSVPCVPDGKILRLCSSVIDGNAHFADLFDVEESMFPIEYFADKKLVHIALQNLGILSQYLPWSLLVERAQKVGSIYYSDKVKALKRAQGVIQCIELTLRNDPDEKGSHSLSKIPFLPVMPKPKGYPLQWYGEAHGLVSGSEVVMNIYGQSHSCDVMSIAGSQTVILNTKSPDEGGCDIIHASAREVLEIRMVPMVRNVVDQLQSLITVFKLMDSAPSVDFLEWSTHICHQAYTFFSQQLQFKMSDKTQELIMISELEHSTCIWTGKCFISPHVVAKEWRHETGPYLFKLPSQLGTKKNLTKLLGIKERFTLSDIASALNRMKNDYEDNPVEQPARAVLLSMIHEVDRIMAYSEGIDIGSIVLPDTTFVMHQACDLSYNDAPWCKLDEKYTLVNEKVNRNLALKLGVKSVRSNMLDKYASKFSCLGTTFGQREGLTRRIHNILRDYPFDITVLKELLQNADDAKANKMWIILDKRTHTNEGILSDSWKNLQGPALLVWNDSVFSEQDLEGIQSIGLGSKGSESESIGQYGIGFNVVYHLTDCPSFISAGETLCVFDPHCCYVDGADQLSPGRRIDVTSKFWDDFPGIKSTFLRDGLQKCPPELMKGSLFRFPLRHTTHHIKVSEILDHTRSPRPITADKMHDNLGKWAPEMKKALLFLNNVKELQFLAIEAADSSLKVDYTFQVQLSNAAMKSRKIVHTAVNAFTQKSGSRSCVERYHITTTESHSQSLSSTRTECWLIQQGVGDINNDSIHWDYISRVKPRHGIAVLLSENDKSSPNNLVGEVFCFLPLPIKSNLPVHVNGHFILDASRRGLWKSTHSAHLDDKAKWNEHLLSAISSSYANLLIHAHMWFVVGLHSLSMELSSYYNIFPHFSESGSANLEGMWLKVAQDVYKKLAILNAPVLASIIDASEPVLISQDEMTYNQSDCTYFSTSATATKQVQVKWHRIHCIDNPSSQVHFFSVADSIAMKEVLKMILQQLRMTITSAPLKIKDQFDSINVTIPATGPETVFNFYATYCCLQESPCHIAVTPFKTVSNFERFVNYLLRKCEVTENSASNINRFEFYEKPFGFFLLITADCMLRHFTKVIQSSFCSLFPQSQSMFLHPDLLKLKLNHGYFLSADDSKQDFSIVKYILLEALSPPIKARNVQNSTALLSFERLKALWICFETDSVFSAQLDNILKHWALLLTTENELFSCPNKECLLPVLMTSSDHIPMHMVLQHIGMPILAAGVITDERIAKRFCPTLNNHVWILRNVFYLHQEYDIKHLLSHEVLKSLLDYFSNINFRSNARDRNFLCCLPVFESITGELTSLSDHSTYMWPNNICSVGKEKWLHGQSTVFLNPNGLWRKIGSGEEIGICTISAEEVYVTYIFPLFHKMTEEERYDQLHYIRDRLIGHAEYNSTSMDSNIKYHATNFISALKVLPCIGDTTAETLLCISDFSDHREQIFTAFPHHYRFLPEKLYKGSNVHEEKKWMDFFCKLGLQQSVSKNMFLDLCRIIEHDEHSSAKNVSSILLCYLLPSGSKNYTSEWHQDGHFLSQVSQIEFVFIEHTPELEWIIPSCTSKSRTMLRGSAYIHHKTLLWTVRPLIELPTNSIINYPQILDELGVITTPAPSDVVANIISMSKSKFANLSLLDHYPEEYSKPDLETHIGVIDVLLQNYTFLNNYSSEVSLQRLNNCPCIPIYANPKTFKHIFVVLVKPNCVLTTRDAEDYFPLMHQLPDSMFGCVPLLEKIGVMRTIGLKHFNTILTTVFEQSNELKLDPNMTEIVKRAIKKMYRMLQESKQSSSHGQISDDDITKALAPLYLPTIEGKLLLSTSLLYCDNSLYKSIDFNLSGTGLQIVSIPQEMYGFWEGELCSCLPKNIKPRKISQCCMQELAPGCTEVQQSHLALRLEESLSLPSLPKLLILLVGQMTKDNVLRIQFQHMLETFLSNVHIQSIHELQTKIQLTTVIPHVCIGTAKVRVHVQNEHDIFTLCLDSHLSPSMIMIPVYNIAQHLITQIKLLGTTANTTTLDVLQQAVEMALQGTSHDDHSMILENILPGFSLDSSDFVFEADVKPRLGKPVPQTWHHRLDQDINNLFHSEEWVGYENEKGDIIFAQVVCPMIPEIPCAFQMKYKVLINEEDNKGIEVNSLSIFKFLKDLNITEMGTHREMIPEGREAEAQTFELTQYKGNAAFPSSTSSTKEKMITLKSAKKELCQKLRAIWQLPTEEKRQAIKRLYLKWHPDKHPDISKVAEEIFKFLLRQLERLKEGLPLEDPDGSGTTHSSSWESSRDQSSFDWSAYFREWDKTAHKHKRYRYSEEDYQEAAGDGSRTGEEDRQGGDGGEWWGSGMEGFDSEEDFTRPTVNVAEGERWLRQATYDYEVLCVIHSQLSSSPRLSGHVCFMAHQVVEKALKGGKYILCGLGENGLKSHSLTDHAYALQMEKPQQLKGLPTLTIYLESYYLDTRYPSRVYSPQIPSEIYEITEADEAKRNAARVLEMMNDLMR